ncbi:MAG: 4Fe-4S binding protein, partial [Firmicutes bacterium]|nr:4Fe-4S binding protein [Bacillota bacterium]
MKRKRKLTQWAVFGLTNAHLSGFVTGTLYKGPLKRVCVPGLNCYSCPGALGACPLGALQSVLGAYNYRFSFYVTGLLLAFGVVFGRFVCGFLCPFGLAQELLHKIPSPKFKLRKVFRYLKYAVLAIFVAALPLLATNFMGMGKPAFCEYICPAGTLTGGIPLLLANPALREALGWLFSLKSAILLLTIAGSVLIYRFFCRTLCPLGAIYSLFNRVSLYQLRLTRERCVRCGACAKACKMEVEPFKQPNAPECVRCGDCVNACPARALKAGFARQRHETL